MRPFMQMFGTILMNGVKVLVVDLTLGKPTTQVWIYVLAVR
jgi:hypothetical protein